MFYCEMRFTGSEQVTLLVWPAGMGFRLTKQQQICVERWDWCWLPDTDLVAAKDWTAVENIADRYQAEIFQELS